MKTSRQAGRGLADAAARSFAVGYGRTQERAWPPPGRVNLIGERTDCNARLVLPFAIGHRTTVAAGRRTDDVISVTSSPCPGQVRAPLSEISPSTAGGSACPLGAAAVPQRHTALRFFNVAGSRVPGIRDTSPHNLVPLLLAADELAAVYRDMALPEMAAAG